MNPNRNLPLSLMLALCASIILIGLFLIPRLDASKKWLADLSIETEEPNPAQPITPVAPSVPPAPPVPVPSPEPDPSPIELPTVAIVEENDPPNPLVTTPDPETVIAIAPEPVPPEAIAITADPPINPPPDSAAVDTVALVSPPSLTTPPPSQDENPVIVVGDPEPAPEPEVTVAIEVAPPDTPPVPDPPQPETPVSPEPELVVAENPEPTDEILGSIFFDAESTRLTGDSLSSLEAILEKLNDSQSRTVVLRGHAGEFEGETNEWIAGVRARRVMAGLLGQGIAEDRVEVDPVVGSGKDSDEKRGRVDIVLIAE
ncbi:MAG: hypothetical protein AAF585_19400 [Verrucomicrobiota bacterium]